MTVKTIAIFLVACACIAALRVTIREQIDAHEQIVRDSEYEKY